MIMALSELWTWVFATWLYNVILLWSFQILSTGADENLLSLILYQMWIFDIYSTVELDN